MAIYTVLAPNVRDGDSTTGFHGDPMDAVFVKERFSWPAFFLAALWLIYRRMWLVLLGYLVVAFAIGALSGELGGPLPGILVFMTHLLFALEANELRRWTLRRHGYRLVGVVEGRGLEEAEIRFFARFDAAASEPAAPPARRAFVAGPLPPSAEAGDVVGLFPAPGGGQP